MGGWVGRWVGITVFFLCILYHYRFSGSQHPSCWLRFWGLAEEVDFLITRQKSGVSESWVCGLWGRFSCELLLIEVVSLVAQFGMCPVPPPRQTAPVSSTMSSWCSRKNFLQARIHGTVGLRGQGPAFLEHDSSLFEGLSWLVQEQSGSLPLSWSQLVTWHKLIV